MSSGKTSTIIALAKTMYKQRYKSMTLEMNASDARGIDVPVQQFWWVSSFVRMRHKKKTGKTMKNWCFQHVEHPEHLNNRRSVGKRSEDWLPYLARYTKSLRRCVDVSHISAYLLDSFYVHVCQAPSLFGTPGPFFGVEATKWNKLPLAGCPWANQDLRQCEAALCFGRGSTKACESWLSYLNLCKVIGWCYLATQNISINMTWWINPCIL